MMTLKTASWRSPGEFIRSDTACGPQEHGCRRRIESPHGAEDSETPRLKVNFQVNHERRKPRFVATLMTVAKEAKSVIAFENRAILKDWLGAAT